MPNQHRDTHAQVTARLLALRAAGATPGEAISDLGITRHTLLQRYRRHPDPHELHAWLRMSPQEWLQCSRAGRWPGRLTTSEMVAEIEPLLVAGRHAASISQGLGTSVSAVARRLQRAGFHELATPFDREARNLRRTA